MRRIGRQVVDRFRRARRPYAQGQIPQAPTHPGLPVGTLLYPQAVHKAGHSFPFVTIRREVPQDQIRLRRRYTR